MNSTMREVLISCPGTGEPVSTGISMSVYAFDELSELAVYTFRCAACGELHTWSKADARLAPAAALD